MATRKIYPPIEVGHKFTRLTVVSPAETRILKGGQRRSQWVCRCDCGAQLNVMDADLKSGNTKSCGCLLRDIAPFVQRTHGQRHTSTYNVWHNMKRRCCDPSNHAYRWYGGRGIYVYEPWLESFENFLRDMGHKPTDRTLGRIDNDGPYSPENCRWETPYEQQCNTTRNVWIEFRGERMIMFEAIRRAGLTVGAVYQRLRNGWALDRALATPLRKRR
jgi:hypothetical protein